MALVASLFQKPRYTNGVKTRRDGKGDGWALKHRLVLGNKFYMTDLDGVFGQLVFASQTANGLFAEYVPDQYANRHKAVRRMGFVAFYDRKHSLEMALGEEKLWLAFHLEMCRRLSDKQPVPVRFFVVDGPGEGPWQMTEFDTKSGQPLETLTVHSEKMEDVWVLLGLVKARRELTKWAETSATQETTA